MRMLHFPTLMALFAILLALSSTPAHAQSSLPAWLSLRQPLSFASLPADSVSAGADSVVSQPPTPIPGQFAPLLPAPPLQSDSYQVGFLNVVYPADSLRLSLPNSVDPNSRMAGYLASAYSLGVNTSPDSVPHNDGLSPLQRARRDFLTSNPAAVIMTSADVEDMNTPDPSRVRRQSSAEMQATIAKIFAPEAQAAESIRKKKEEPQSPWTTSGEENLQFTQLAVANWIKGGENNVALTHDLRMKALYSKNKIQWESNLTSKTGLTVTSALGARISNDELNLTSKFGYNAVNKWYYSLLLTFKTQLFRNYSNSDKTKSSPKSTLLSPAYQQFIVGMDYKKDNLSLLLSPYTCILTIVADTADIDQTSYGVSANSRTNWVNGFSVTLNWKKVIIYGMSYTTNLEVFYEYFRKDGNKRFDWESIFDMQFNRFLSTRFLLDLRFYDNESDRFQLKENFSISFKYTF